MAAALAVAAPAAAQVMVYAPEPGTSALYRTRNLLTVSQTILERDNHYAMESSGVVRLTLLDGGPRMLWRLGYDELALRIEGAFPTPRAEALRGTVVTLATTPQGQVLDALASGVVTAGIGAQYVERAAAAFLPHLPGGRVARGASWTDTLSVTEILQGVTAEVRTIVTFTVQDTTAWAGRSVVPVDYRGRIEVDGAGTIEGSRVTLSGAGELEGHYLYDPGERLFALHEQEQSLDSTLTVSESSGGPIEIPSRQVLRARAERLY